VSDLTERLADQARRDPMTGLPNRTAVLEHLSDALRRRERSDHLLAVLFVDLDGFKVINDAFGHVTGDDVLREMGQRFRVVARAGEMVARLGGDEFVAIVECTGDPTRALTLGRRLIEAAERPVVVDDTEVTLSASVGVAVSSADSTPMGLLGEADQAVYEAKREGKARVRLYDTDLQAVMANRAALERELRRAIIADEFDIYLQPVVDADGGRLRSAEALVRWNRPGHGVVLPAEFIPFAEGSWLVVEIGRIVLDKACRALAGWVAEGHNHTVSVNIAGRHLVEADLVGDVRAALERHGAPPELFVVELTESQLVTDLDKAAAVLGELRALGVHVSLDDFGTGHSSLTYLRQLPIDTIKIDGSYINELGTTPDAHALIASLIHLADSLHLDVIAEGVETVEQADQLRAIGCPKLQGFLIARPLPLEQFAIPSLTAN
jgi:diguanylate cyclase (GGDEF)-like protein